MLLASVTALGNSETPFHRQGKGQRGLYCMNCFAPMVNYVPVYNASGIWNSPFITALSKGIFLHLEEYLACGRHSGSEHSLQSDRGFRC